jgi:eukaryotic-like serine/threonine-protein kinase
VTLLAGRYELTEELGEGGMGRVMVAHDQMLGRDVAVKLLSPSADRTSRERFIREARSAAQLHHPNAVAVYDTGEDDGQPYLVMELVRGDSLADVLEREGPLEIEEAIGITVGVLNGLAAAHRAGMVHRDVKPANVLLPEEGGVKLSDFGIAKALGEVDSELTAAGSLMGTPTYLAPELIGGDKPSPASDIYGVGCLLYAQLTGSPPFTRGEPLVVAYAHLNEEVTPVEAVRPEVPTEIATVVAKALEKDPARRYPDAPTMRTALLDGPEAAPLTGDQTVAMAAAAAPDGTHVLQGGENDTTRAIGAAAAAPAAAPARAPAPAPAPTRRRRWWIPVLIVVAVLLLGWLLWSALADTPGDGELMEPEDDVEVEEPEEEVEEPVEEAPPPPDEAPEPPPADTPEPEEPPAEEPPAEEEPPEEEEPPAEEEEPPPEEDEEAQPPPEDETTWDPDEQSADGTTSESVEEDAAV